MRNNVDKMLGIYVQESGLSMERVKYVRDGARADISAVEASDSSRRLGRLATTSLHVVGEKRKNYPSGS